MCGGTEFCLKINVTFKSFSWKAQVDFIVDDVIMSLAQSHSVFTNTTENEKRYQFIYICNGCCQYTSTDRMLLHAHNTI